MNTLILQQPDAGTPADFMVDLHSALGVALTPCTHEAQEWMAENLGDPTAYLGETAYIEAPYFFDIGEAFTADGLTAIPA